MNRWHVRKVSHAHWRQEIKLWRSSSDGSLRSCSQHCVCVALQAKAEEVDLSNPTAMSDNLIDFTDPTPVVGSQRFKVTLRNFVCPEMIVLEEFSDELPCNLRMEPLPEGPQRTLLA